MNFEELNVMLRAPKIILSEDNQAINDMTIDASFPIKRLRYTLGLLETVNNTRLMWQINQSEKMQIRLSLHIQQEETNIGLIRLDYNAGHRNPTEISPNLPAVFHDYAGFDFANCPAHVHFHTENTPRDLVWALPIDECDIDIKDFDGRQPNVRGVIQSFAKYINLTTQLAINVPLI